MLQPIRVGEKLDTLRSEMKRGLWPKIQPNEPVSFRVYRDSALISNVAFDHAQILTT